MKRTVCWWFGSWICMLPIAAIVPAEEILPPPGDTAAAVAPDQEAGEGRTLGQRIFGLRGELDGDQATEVDPPPMLVPELQAAKPESAPRSPAPLGSAAKLGGSSLRIVRVAEANEPRRKASPRGAADRVLGSGVVQPLTDPLANSVRREEPMSPSANQTANQPASESGGEPGNLAPVAIDRPPAAPEMSAEMQELKAKVRRTLAYYYQHPESTGERSPWAIMHCFIGFGVDTQIIVGDRPVNAIAWTCWNGPCYGMRLFYADGGYIVPRIGPGYQGHPGQFLAMMAQCKVKPDYGMKADGHDFTIRDLIEYEKVTCKPNSELTFKLIGLSHYLDTDATWKDEHGSDWDIERLIYEELKQPIVGGTCGGTHRMMGFNYAVKKRESRGEPMTGQWLRARKYLDDYFAYTFKLQNEDGSFSTRWFEGPGDVGTIDRRVQTTGHILEWLVASLPAEQLTDPRVVHAVNYLADLLLENRGHRWEIGPQGHAIHALCVYDERVFGGKPGQRAVQLAAERGSRVR